jgi:cytochrome oxidase Cu insertion factor (SCO1/SenC/PrrC family)
MRNWRTLLSLASGIALGAAGLCTADHLLSARQPPHRKENFDRFPNVWLTTHEGRKVHFFDDLVKNKIVAINFFYSACTDF